MTKWIIIASSFILFFGYMGLAGLILVVLFYFILTSLKKENIIQEQEDSVESNIIKLDEIIKKESSKNFNLNDLESYKEIIYSGTQDEKIELIGMVVFNPSREYVELIRQLLKDEDETIRILASNSLQKMENYFENIIDTLNKQIKMEHDKDTKKELYLKLVDTYDKFIDSSLLESFIIPEFESKIFEAFHKLPNNTDEDIKKSFLKMSVKYNKYNPVIEEIKKRIESSNNIVDKFLLAEIYYKQNRIDLIKEVLLNIKRKEIKDIKLKNSYDYWTNYAY